MHGFIFSELKKFTDARLGARGWEKIQLRAGLGPRVYVPTQEYPDAEAGRLVDATALIAGITARAVLEELGAFIVPDLMRVYGPLVDGSWRTLDVIANTEQMIHRVVRLRDSSAKPPELVVTRSAPEQVSIRYTSHRRMCGIAVGIVRGLAGHYRETVAIAETSCMHDGAPACVIDVRLTPA
jgi:predicted hydrocarbon binding protein